MPPDQTTVAPTVTPPAVTTTTTTPPVVVAPAATTTPSEWTSGLNDELKGYVQSKGFKDPASVLESYRNYEKLQGVPQERLLKLPENMNTPEGRAILEKLGAPKEAKDYSITIPKEHGDEGLAEWMRGVAFENGFTAKQVEGLVSKWNERAAGTIKEQTDAHTTAIAAAQVEIKAKWGAAYEQNKNLLDQVAATLQWDNNQLAAFGAHVGYAKAADMLVSLAKATGEHAFIGGQPPANTVMTPAQAQAEIKTLIYDKDFQARMGRKDADARKKWDSLNQMASPGTMTI